MAVFKLLFFVLYYWFVLCENKDQQDRTFNLVARDRTFANTPFVTFSFNVEQRCLSLCSYEERCKSYDILTLSTGKVECRLFNFTYAYHSLNETSKFEDKPGIRLYSKHYSSKQNCFDWYKAGATSNGIYEVSLTKKITRKVYCYMEGEGGGWMAFQRRFNGSVKFRRNWNEYKEGFGNHDGEYWLGNDLLHELTSLRRHDLFVIATNFSDVSQTKRFSDFTIGSEQEKYKFDYALDLPGYSEHALYKEAKTMKFSTHDQDNDAQSSYSCAELYHGGWWYKACHSDAMNGRYYPTATCDWAEGLHWASWTTHYQSLKSTLLMMKPMG